MRGLLIIIIIPAAFLVTGCSATKEAPSGGLESAYEAVQNDSTSASAHEELFFELHAELIEKLDSMESAQELSPDAVEADSIVKAAEDLYLRGNLTEALKLLEEAKRILEQSN